MKGKNNIAKAAAKRKLEIEEAKPLLDLVDKMEKRLDGLTFLTDCGHVDIPQDAATTVAYTVLVWLKENGYLKIK